MKPPAFTYCDPDSVDEAVALKNEYGIDSLVLAGGQSLLPMLNIRLARPEALIDINRISDLQKIERWSDVLEIGAGVRQYQLEDHPLVQELVPLLPQAVKFIGHIENRHRGTVGGSIAHADSAAELPCTAVALDATLVVRGPSGSRTIAARDFFQGWMTTALEPEEVLVAVRYPVMPWTAGHGFVEVARREGDFALAGAAAVVNLGEDGRIASLAVSAASISDTPVRATAVEQALAGELPTKENIARAAKEIVPSVTSGDDMHATRAYRQHLATVVVQRAITAAVARAHERSNAQ
ncbi:xanthine dehydrogenase family protein subunit M [Streptomyces cellulosae]|jgi:carbon-monoxide dehydrogenase medium subunit|uniref:FAD binding domain-containing protein n=2 Tax=Streptomyces TaxID=1883 RepID=A0ABW6JGB2_STRCE|nr:xanthine dehydrogenase family protein subunit M [Streptomyces sp. McG8]MCP8708358.1 xanthine dehydrogenase family protein subunit M [Streptomyces sp. AC04842]MCX4476346.1 xanthine dehydrogenase family protein subunit M [Streptomyces cellulosae]MDN3287249.1 xanthine dehydrogenase family protein subunit M [Streptomyces thermocarboxydus]MDQ0489813.1 carbon-monoxide dehydrogenase medium subunit [Streptomyces thermodiastaticus]MXQ60544.1 xanthine dehydrogenase family protein subunit M [Streptomy